MKTHNLGYPRIGSQRELKKACEMYWSGKITPGELHEVASTIRSKNWSIQQDTGLDWIPVNDFSYYDHVLDHCILFNVIPERFKLLKNQLTPLDLYFAMARGYQSDTQHIAALEMTKWFNTNYHYLVPEWDANQVFQLNPEKILHEIRQAHMKSISVKPVLIGPVSLLLLGKAKSNSINKLELLPELLTQYIKLLKMLIEEGIEYIQMDEPFLSTDLDAASKEAINLTYHTLHNEAPSIGLILTTYFDALQENIPLIVNLPVQALHIDGIEAPEEVLEIAHSIPDKMSLSLGVVDGRNIWKSNFRPTLEVIRKILEHITPDRLWLAPSCSLLHVPCDLTLENKNQNIPDVLFRKMAFARQKLEEIQALKTIILRPNHPLALELYSDNVGVFLSHNRIKPSNIDHLDNISAKTPKRAMPYAQRKALQNKHLNLPTLPTTTIGSLPQTRELRKLRNDYKKGKITSARYEENIEARIKEAIEIQERLGLDVLVHGEFERNDMVEYFGEQLDGFAFTQYGWVQSYGSRCVKPPIIYDDVLRPHDITVRWTKMAQEQTKKPVKGMLTGPVTILQWSFVRNDIPVAATCLQIARALKKEVLALEKAGIRIIQIDEPALREGLPLRKNKRAVYWDWAISAFLITTNAVKNETQIHTHMCYSEFNEIINYIAALDADVITIETARSEMELLNAFLEEKYPNSIGPGVYDIHVPAIPTVKEVATRLYKALQVIPEDQLWVNPDCGLKTRTWEEVVQSLQNMVEATMTLRSSIHQSV